MITQKQKEIDRVNDLIRINWKNKSLVKCYKKELKEIEFEKKAQELFE